MAGRGAARQRRLTAGGWAAALLLAGGCVAVVAGPPTPLPSDGSGVITAASLEAEVHRRINAHREGRGLPPLRREDALGRLAREHSAAMAAGRIPFGHDGFNARSTAAAAELPAVALAENVAWDDGHEEGLAGRVIDGWLRSSGHRRNIEGGFGATGVGVAVSSDGRFYLTQIFLQDAP